MRRYTVCLSSEVVGVSHVDIRQLGTLLKNKVKVQD